MGFYNDVVLPRLCHLAMRNRRLVFYRQRAVAAAEGRVLEIGIGSGLNLPFYGPQVREALGLEPAPPLVAMARRAATSVRLPVRLIEGSAEAIPLETDSVDTVVTTWTMCTIPAIESALAEARRVLKPGGRLLFVEHGLSPDPAVRKWQNRLTPAWRCVAGGCRLNRPIRNLVESGGFRLDRLATGYAPGPKFVAFMYEGSAVPI